MRKFKNYRAIISQFIAVVMNKTDKIRQDQIQIDDKQLQTSIWTHGERNAQQGLAPTITDLQRENHIDDMTRNT